MGRKSSGETMQNYLKVIFSLTIEMGRDYAKTSDIARILGVAPSSVTEMLRKLAQKGLVDYTQRKGVRLNDSSMELAISLIRRYRLAELLLFKIIGLDLTSATEIACKLEHIMTDKMEEKTIELLNNPEKCPHGNYIPYGFKDVGKIIKRGNLLSEVEEKGHFRVIKVFDINPNLLRIVTRLNILPGTIINVIDIFPERNLLIEINGNEHVISPQIAATIVVERI
ncbi:MAG: metal-dependent transcriptional regulator [Candidatus Asgardarchaeum sp.]